MKNKKKNGKRWYKSLIKNMRVKENISEAKEKFSCFLFRLLLVDAGKSRHFEWPILRNQSYICLYQVRTKSVPSPPL